MARKLTSMTMETAAFAKGIRAFAKKSQQAHATALRKIVFLLLRMIILAWPVLTGRSRAGWGVAARLVGLDVPPPPKPVEAAVGFVPGEAHFAGLRFQATNNVAYAERLEEGWSLQAPAGVVRLSMRRVVAMLGGRQLPNELLTDYRGIWETGRIPTRAFDPNSVEVT